MARARGLALILRHAWRRRCVAWTRLEERESGLIIELDDASWLQHGLHNTAISSGSLRGANAVGCGRGPTLYQRNPLVIHLGDANEKLYSDIERSRFDNNGESDARTVRSSACGGRTPPLAQRAV